MKFARLTPGPGFAPLQSLGYYAQRVVTNRSLRRAVVAALRAGVRWRSGAWRPAVGANEQWSQALDEHGCVDLGLLLSTEQCAAVLAYLRDKPMVDRHNDATTFTLDAVPQGVHLGDYPMRHVLACPHILQLANSPALLGLATRYIGCKPTISALSLRWSFPNHSGEQRLQAFHRDSDDWRYLKVMVYLTDVDEQSGPHVFVCGTHRSRASLRLRFYPDEQIRREYAPELVRAVTGPSGFAFAVDTAGIHKGAVPTGRRRLMLQIQYSLLPSYAYRYEPQVLECGQQFDRHINRLLLSPG